MSYSSEVLADSPLAYWRLGDPSGTTMTDGSGNSHNGTYQNSPSLAQASLLLTDAANTAVKFLASGTQFATVANAAWMNFNGDFTVECWVKPAVSVTAATARQYVAKYNTAGGGNGLYLCIDTAGKPTFGLRFAGSDITIIASTAVALGNIYHIVGVRSGTTSTLYVNGVSAGTSTNSGNPAADASTLAVGALSGIGQYADATIDEVAFYNTALSPTRVGVHYTAGTSASATVLPPAAGATAAGVVPSVAATSLVLPPTATSSAAAVSPAVTGTGDGTVLAPAATASAVALAPVLSADALVEPLAAAASGAGVVPAVTATASQTITAPAAAASAAAIAPFISNDSPDATIEAPSAHATAAGHAPLLGVAVGSDTSNAFTGRSRDGFATLELTVPVVPPPAVSTTYRVDKAVPLPLPVLVKGRPT